MRIYKIGEDVRFVDDVGTGTVVAVLDHGQYRVVDEHGFEENYDGSELMKAVQDYSDSMSDNIPEVAIQKNDKQPIHHRGFHVGQRVRPLDETGEGVLDHFKGDLVYVHMDFGIMLEYHFSKIVSAENDPTLSLDLERENYYKAEDFAKPIKAKKTARKESGVWEIDLHVHEITDKTDNLSPHQLLRIQLDFFEEKLVEAINRQVRRVIFIHGIGKGKLKNEIRKILDRYPRCEYLDGNYQSYGVGATEVIIRNM